VNAGTRGPHLALLTSHFPFGLGEQFLETELPFLARHFERVTVVPKIYDRDVRPLPAGVTLDLGLATPRLPGRLVAGVASSLASPLFYRELIRYPAIMRHTRALGGMAVGLGDAARTARWAAHWLAAQDSADPLNYFVFCCGTRDHQFRPGDGIDIGKAPHQCGDGNHDFVVAIHSVRIGAPRLEHAHDAKEHGTDLNVGAERVFILEQLVGDSLTNDRDARRGFHSGDIE